MILFVGGGGGLIKTYTTGDAPRDWGTTARRRSSDRGATGQSARLLLLLLLSNITDGASACVRTYVLLCTAMA